MIKRIGRISLLFCISLILAEGILRILGFGPHEIIKTEILSNPTKAFTFHPKLGLGLNPGTFEVTINEGLKYKATHLSDSTRITSLHVNRKGPEIHYYGCSFTYGMGVDDQETYPFLVQNSFPMSYSQNFAAPAYGTVHGLLQLKENLKRGKKPDIAILGYTSYQDARNQLSGNQQKYWSESFFPDRPVDRMLARFPYAKIKGGNLLVEYLPLENFAKRSRLSKYSVVWFRMEIAISNIIYGIRDKHELTERIFEAIKTLCSKNAINLLIVNLDKSHSGKLLEKYCRSNNISFLDAAIDISDPKYNLQPYDSHPNAEAHKLYATEISNYLINNPRFSKNN